MDRGRAEELLGAIAIFLDRREKFLMEFSNRMGERVMPGGRDWNPKMSDAEATLDCDDKLELEFDIPIRAMKDGSIATAINTGDFSIVDSSNSVKSTRHDPVMTKRADRDNTSEWGGLDDTKILT